MTAGLATLSTSARFVRPLVLRQRLPCCVSDSRFASALPFCVSARATHTPPCPRRRSDAFDALQLEFTVYLLTTWRHHKQMALMDFPKALVQSRRLSEAPARCWCHSLPTGLRGRVVSVRAALRTHSESPRARQPPLPQRQYTCMAPPSARANGAHFLRRFQSRTRERIEHMVPRIEAGSCYQIRAVGGSTPSPAVLAPPTPT